MSTRTFRMGVSAPLLFALACGEPPKTPQTPQKAPPVAAVKAQPPPAPPASASRSRTLFFADEIPELSPRDLSSLQHLDLSFSKDDLVGQLEAARGRPGCEALDLIDLAQRLPSLTSLRVSGCSRAVAAGLSAFGDRLVEVELADMDLDAVAVGRLAQLTSLQGLTLTRVTPRTSALSALRKLPIRRLALRELERDSTLSGLISMWPATLQELELEGQWAGHVAMTYVPAAKELRSLSLQETRVGNFSLNQVKLLTGVSSLSFSGRTFNDHTPQMFRDLPITTFRCACPGLGDEGLRNIRHLDKLKTLDLPESRITDGGLIHLAQLEELEELTLLGVSITGEGILPLVELSKLKRLRLGGADLPSSRLDALGELAALEHLSLRFPTLTDDIARALRPLVRLRRLDLAHTQVSDAVLPAIGDLRELEFLALHHTRVTRDLSPLGKLAHLRVLELDHTDLVDEGVVPLALLRSLTRLRLDSTLITDKAVDALLSLTKLRELNLANTVISAEAAARLHALPALEQLHLADPAEHARE